MCLAEVGRVLSVDAVLGSADISSGDRLLSVSLAPLLLGGVQVEPGSWVVVHTGLAVELIDDDAAAEVLAERARMRMDETR